MMLIRGILETQEGVEKCLDTVESAELNVSRVRTSFTSSETKRYHQVYHSNVK